MLVNENEHATGIGYTKTRKRKRNEMASKRNKKKHARLEGRAVHTLPQMVNTSLQNIQKSKNVCAHKNAACSAVQRQMMI